MNREEILQIAREAGIIAPSNSIEDQDIVWSPNRHGVSVGQLEKFVELIVVEARKHFADVCNSVAEVAEETSSGAQRRGAVAAAKTCENLILTAGRWVPLDKT